MKKAETRQEIACQQVLTGEGSVFSIQWTVFPARLAATLTPQFVFDEYMAYLRRFTFSLARPTRTTNGFEFRIIFTKLHILSFAAPAFADAGGVHSVTLRICGGPFVQNDQCNRGRFSFLSEKIDGGVKVTVHLADYFPRLLGSSPPSLFRKWLYRFTQAALHKLMTTRFLAHLYRELTDEAPSFRVVAVYEHPGEKI